MFKLWATLTLTAQRDCAMVFTEVTSKDRKKYDCDDGYDLWLRDRRRILDDFIGDADRRLAELKVAA